MELSRNTAARDGAEAHQNSQDYPAMIAIAESLLLMVTTALLALVVVRLIQSEHNAAEADRRARLRRPNS